MIASVETVGSESAETAKSLPAETGKSNAPGRSAAWTMFPFLAFCWTSLLLVGLAEGLAVYLVYPRLEAINHNLFILFLAAAAAFFIVLFGGLTLITITSLTGIDLLYPHGKRSVTVRLLFPIAVFLAEIVRYNRSRLMASFVKVNNSMTIAQAGRIRGDRILVLLPHCLQIDICHRKITNDISNCVRCGRCSVGGFLDAGDKYNLKIEVVNGGTLARKRVAAWRPQGIIAVACERDLTLGIQDVHPVPVYGVINDRPHGPCVNTCVDMDTVDQAIKFFKESGGD